MSPFAAASTAQRMAPVTEEKRDECRESVKQAAHLMHHTARVVRYDTYVVSVQVECVSVL